MTKEIRDTSIVSKTWHSEIYDKAVDRWAAAKREQVFREDTRGELIAAVRSAERDVEGAIYEQLDAEYGVVNPHKQDCQLAYITEEEARLKDYGCTCPPNFRQSSSPTEQGAESVHSGKQNTADKSKLLPTQLPKEK